MIKPIIIAGPTASGKSTLGLWLAKEINGVIISADSMQIYRKMDIGTAKPTEEERKSVPHKLIDIVDIGESFSVSDYKEEAEKEIEAAMGAEKVPVIVGGTGLYIDALVNNTDFGDFECPPDIRARLVYQAENGGGAELYDMLTAVDPKTAARLHVNDTKRIIRALEIYIATGKTMSYYIEKSRLNPPKYEYLMFIIEFADRSALYERIDRRIDEMLLSGLCDETKALYKDGLADAVTAAQAIGYKELCGWLEGRLGYNEAVELLKRRTRNYAKRQISWFSRYESAIRLYADRGDTADPARNDRVLTKVKKFLS
ncbi:MAG: tRNA (adenosine(37)-N6)-dimethylallyltransferase MiaA [Oscillospiraceae bacterium]|nr:tRNA (adenosine(37)-N6)-dimethylallyltransferase MiaA [Oscillospiraceae bacterium]